MNFDFDEDQYRIAESVGRFLGGAAPGGEAAPSAELWDGLAELGVLGALVPDTYDGLGLSLVDVALAVEQLGRGLAPVSTLSTLAAADAITRFGTDAQRQAMLPKIAAGELNVAIALVESEAGYDPAEFKTAVTTEAGKTTLNGRKLLVPHGAEADLILVVARLERGRPGVLLLPRDRAGVSVQAEQTLDPASACVRIDFDGAPVTDADVLGASAGPAVLARLIDVAATLSAGYLVGAAGKLLDISVDYARQRVQFDKPIGAFQAIKHRCADLAVAVDAARSAAYYAFWAAAEDAPDRTRASAMAKAYCGEIADQAARDAIQVHGGIGFTWELGLHWYLRRIKLVDHSFGDARHFRETVLAETLSMLGERAERPSRSAA